MTAKTFKRWKATVPRARLLGSVPETPEAMHARIVTETADAIAKERGLTAETKANRCDCGLPAPAPGIACANCGSVSRKVKNQLLHPVLIMAKNKELEELLRLMAPAMQDILWCALVWNDHTFGYTELLAKADRAAKSLGFDRRGYRKDPIDDANKLFARIDRALATANPACDDK